ncbi:MAG TPA: sulfatase-like hydrolase/transferase, partial [Thermoanaerobaculia bacterium]
MTWTQTRTALALSALAALAAACGGDRDGEALRAPEGTPVILVSVDTLRSDRLPMYGHDGVETPALDAFRKDAILFEHAYAHVPLTLPSHVSLLSGLLPPGHGVRDNLGYEARPAEHAWLPRILRENGYETGAAISAFVLRASTGFGTDFDFFEDDILQRSWQIGESQRTGDKTLGASRAWLRSVHREPFFFLFHIYEPHQPLTPPEPFASRYPEAYDGEVASADAIVGELFAELRELGVYDRALIVFLSDHGEGLGDHGLAEHGPLLYREQIQVPLMVKLPGGELAGATVAAHGIGLDAIAKGMSNRRFQEELFRTRERLGLRLIEAPRAPKEVLRALRAGRVVAILGDQNAAEGGVFVPFFGKDAATARGPALFALRTGVPVFVGVALRRPGPTQRYDISVRRLNIEPTGDLEADVHALLAAYAG